MARVVEIQSLSIVWSVFRVLKEAQDAGRLTETEAAIIRDLISHDELPRGFFVAPDDGGFKRQERF